MAAGAKSAMPGSHRGGALPAAPLLAPRMRLLSGALPPGQLLAAPASIIVGAFIARRAAGVPGADLRGAGPLAGQPVVLEHPSHRKDLGILEGQRGGRVSTGACSRCRTWLPCGCRTRV